MVSAEATNKPFENLRDEFSDLWAKADAIWEERMNRNAFRGYVSADYSAIYEKLISLQGQVQTVLEWGSGLGVMTIMASRMGFDAYGIESELELIELSEQFAEEYQSDARFSHGSFIPEEFDYDPGTGDEIYRTFMDLEASYQDLDMEIRDFDLVYAYPWPDEQSLFKSIVRDFGGRLLMLYDAREGLSMTRFY